MMADRPLNMATRYFTFPDDIIPVWTVRVWGGCVMGSRVGVDCVWCGDGEEGRWDLKV